LSEKTSKFPFQKLDQTPAFLQWCTHSVWLVMVSSLVEASDKESQVFPCSPPSVVTIRGGGNLGMRLKYSWSPTVLLLVQYIHHMKPWK